MPGSGPDKELDCAVNCASDWELERTGDLQSKCSFYEIVGAQSGGGNPYQCLIELQSGT